jgi:hypothetical protein
VQFCVSLGAIRQDMESEILCSRLELVGLRLIVGIDNCLPQLQPSLVRRLQELEDRQQELERILLLLRTISQ